MKGWVQKALLICIGVFVAFTVFGNSEKIPLEVLRHRAKTQSAAPAHPIAPDIHIVFPKPQSTKKLIKPRQLAKRNVIYNGSLEENIKRISRAYGWSKVIWDVENDYQWVGTTRIRSTNLPNLLRQILQNYPLQAVFYRGNHVLVIQPRTLK